MTLPAPRRALLKLAAAAPLGLAPLRLAAQAARRGGTLKIIISPEPPTLMLGLQQTTPTAIVGGKIYESLLRYDRRLTPMPGLAKSWTISPDGKVYTFHLQDDVFWHDGVRFTAADVVFSARTYLVETHPRSRPIFQRCEEIGASDEQTVVFRLKQPFAPFIMAFEPSTVPIVPRHIYEGTDFRANPANTKPVGTGPFRLQEWVSGSHILLTRFERYWQQGKPHLDALLYRIIPDAASRAVALESGEIYLAAFSDVEPFDVPRLKALPHLDFTTEGYEYVAQMVMLDFNHRNPPMNDKRFRQAVYYALDRDFIRDKLWFGLGKVATGPIHSSMPHYDADVPQYRHDPTRAEALLDEMGLKKGPDGSRARVTMDVLPYGTIYVRLAEYVKQALARVGIQVELRSADIGAWGDRVRNWNYDMTFEVLSQLGHPGLGLPRLYMTEAIRKGILFSNTMGYSNPKVDALMEEAAVEVDPAPRQKLWSEAQRLMVEDVPMAWLLELTFPTFIDKRFRDVVTSAIGVRDNFADVSMIG